MVIKIKGDTMKTTNSSVIISCSRCTAHVPITKSTYENGKNLICFDCYNKVVKGQIPDRIIQTGAMPDRVNYSCYNCGFKFTRGPDFQFGGQCFNCGKQSIKASKIQQQEVMKDRKSLLDY
jgi:DNA-directed RNA polymerase subunit RPC12/RpoP